MKSPPPPLQPAPPLSPPLQPELPLSLPLHPELPLSPLLLLLQLELLLLSPLPSLLLPLHPLDDGSEELHELSVLPLSVVAESPDVRVVSPQEQLVSEGTSTSRSTPPKSTPPPPPGWPLPLETTPLELEPAPEPATVPELDVLVLDDVPASAQPP